MFDEPIMFELRDGYLRVYLYANGELFAAKDWRPAFSGWGNCKEFIEENDELLCLARQKLSLHLAASNSYAEFVG